MLKFQDSDLQMKTELTWVRRMVIWGTVREGWGDWSYASGNCSLRYILLTLPPALLRTKAAVFNQMNQ